jgi:hypothetical protein
MTSNKFLFPIMKTLWLDLLTLMLVGTYSKEILILVLVNVLVV